MHQTLERALSDARAGNLQRALEAVRLHIRLHARSPEGFEVQSLLLLQSGRPDEAIASLVRAVAIAPAAVAPRVNLASALQTVGRYHEAIDRYVEVLAIDERNLAAWHGLARSRLQLDDLSGAVEACHGGLALVPSHPDLTVVLATALEAGGDVPSAVACLRSALALHPRHDRLREKYMMLLNYLDLPVEEIMDAHVRFGARSTVSPSQQLTDPDPDKRLRIGVLSGDLRTHAVAHFARAIFSPARADVELVVFSCFPSRPSAHGATVRAPDPVESWFRAASSEWIEAHALDDSTLDAAIRSRRIDVLVDLAAHTAHGRLAALERRPAPVSVTAIGYPNTTGSPAVDWRIVDSTTDPRGSEPLCTERLLRVDPCFLCFAAPENGPEPSMRDAGTQVAFGSFNLLSKISDRTIRLWASVLAAVPSSHLVLKSKWLAGADSHGRMRGRFASAGVDPERIRFLDYASSPADHLACYASIDIALDTTPYNGTTTTCEALWMGVPVITLRGDRHCARVGASLLSAAGMPDMVASNESEFVDISSSLAHRAAWRSEFRANCRAMLRASALMDATGYGARFHAAVRAAWREWCTQRSRSA